MTSKQKITYPTILAATQGSPEAIHRILRYYAPYIAYFSRCSIAQNDGMATTYVNYDILEQVEAELMYGIVTKFDPFQLPHGETLKED